MTIETKLNARSADFQANAAAMQTLVDHLRGEVASLLRAVAKQRGPSTLRAASCRRASGCKCC